MGKFLDLAGLEYLCGKIKADLTGKQDQLTGQPGQLVGFGTDGVSALKIAGGRNIDLEREAEDLTIHALVPGQNILRNWDFRRPVNRRGKTEYAGNWLQAIDGWAVVDNSTMVIEDGYLHFDFSRLNPRFLSQVSEIGFHDGGTYTFSLFYKSGCKVRLILDFLQGDQSVDLMQCSDIQPSSGTWTIGSVTFSTERGVHYDAINVILEAVDMTDISETVDIIAVKLERGSRQTLARENADSTWELIDPPNYDLQYALCSLYSLTTGKWVGYQHSNPNLLDNWYFLDPIDQRGQEAYDITGINRYFIDRWIGTYIKATRESDGLLVTSERSPTFSMYQRVGHPQNLAGKTVTFSILCTEVTAARMAIRGDAGNGSENIGKTTLTIDSPGLHSITSTIPENAVVISPGFLLQAGNRIKVTAAKLELGSAQTLARQDAEGKWVLKDAPPNKAMELLKCQRYYQVFTSQELRPIKAADFRPVMRANPALGTLVLDGETYYTADANL